MNKKYAGQLLIFTLVKDDELPYCYAYGVRLSEEYGAHFIRTTPVMKVDHKKQHIFTLFNRYNFLYFTSDPAYQAILFKLFSKVITPVIDDELIIAPVKLTLQ